VGGVTVRIHLSTPDISAVEETYVLAALRSGWVSSVGPDVDAFEAEVAELVGVKYALALSSGTAALHLALVEVGAGPDTVVVLPTMTFAATANAVTYTGAEPVFVDCRPDDGNVDPELMLEAVDELRRRGRTVAAAITVDLMGRACDYDILEPALAERGVPLIEDAAEALGARLQHRAAGSFGRLAALSFNGNKIMTTSGGGMLLSDDPELIAHARKISSQARESAPWYEHAETGYNYRMSNILAALGRGQLTRLSQLIQRRRQIRQAYTQALDGAAVRFLHGRAGRDDQDDNCWLTTLVLDGDVLDAWRIIEGLGEVGIEARHLWKPMHLQPLFAGAQIFGGAHARHMFQHGLALPSGSTLTDGEVATVITEFHQHTEGRVSCVSPS